MRISMLPRPITVSRPIAAVTVLVLLAMSALVLTGSRADAQGRSVEVSVGAGLVAGQTITVSWSGYTPGATVYVHQCTNGATLWRDCAEVSRRVGVSDAAGSGSLTFPVWAGDIPRPPGVVGSNGPIICEGGSCMIAVSECGFDLAPARTATRRIFLAGQGGQNPDLPPGSTTTTTTAPPAPPPPTGERIDGIVDSDSQLLTQAWQFAVLEEPRRLDVDMTTVNAPSANDGFATGFYDFAITNLPLDPLQQQQLAERETGYAYVPVAVNAFVMGFQFKVNGIDVKELNLRAETVARLYRGDISTFNNPLVTADMDGCAFRNTNAGTSYPVPTFRNDRSGSNWVLNSWLDANANELWAPVLEITGGITPTFGIEDARVVGETGAEKLASLIQFGRPGESGVDNDRLNAPVAGRLGMIDRSLAHELDMDVVRIRLDDQTVLEPTDEAILAGIEAGTWLPSGVLRRDYAPDNPAAWPIPVVYYALVPTTLSPSFTAEQAEVLKQFLTYTVSDEGQELAEELGFVPLPADLQARATAVIATIGTPEAPPPPPPPPTGPGDPTPVDPPPLEGGFTDDFFGPDPLFFDDQFFDSGSFADSFDDSFAGDAGSTGFDDAGFADELALDEEAAVDADDVDEEEQSATARLVSAVVGAAGPLFSVPMLAALGLAALAVGPLLRMQKRRQGDQ